MTTVSVIPIPGTTLIPGTIPIHGVTRITVIILTGTGIILIGEVADTATIMEIGTGTTEITGTTIMDREGPFLPPMAEETPEPAPPEPSQS